MITRISALLVSVVALLTPIQVTAQETRSRSILVLDQADMRGPFYYQVFSGFRSVVNTDGKSHITLYTESLDLSRFRGKSYEASLRRHFKDKYQDIPIGVVVAIGSAGTWLRGGRYASTDDAYVQAAKVVVSTDVSGIVTAVEVHEGQAVNANDVLFRLDPRQFQIALDNAKAQLAETALTIEAMKQDYKRMLSDIDAQQAQVSLDQVTFDRYATLVQSESVSQLMYDQARFTLAADQSKLQS